MTVDKNLQDRQVANVSAKMPPSAVSGVDRSPSEKARILAHLQCMLAEARAIKGADHADA